MTATEKRVLLILIAALLLGSGMLVVRRERAARLAASAPVLMTQELDEPALRAGERSRAAVGLVNVNAASGYELEALPGIGPVIAGRIIAYRDKHGPFRRVEQLLRVSGIGPKRLEAIVEYVTLGEANE
ncbi:MAG TPA: helix-hairpin-helix domain-containing protein [candidate division WOR-3 bacterium]|uniref:Helix-hairpin-helix domain-containing protein n=1 Tax=candidate division WOR-3 bacterium TaxID=2052148 RepID=A0A7V0T7K7_UNCW3|nr:helix-hairpin-helix domain-containing protein [candidate division WOR-3 bacterium]